MCSLNRQTKPNICFEAVVVCLSQNQTVALTVYFLLTKLMTENYANEKQQNNLTYFAHYIKITNYTDTQGICLKNLQITSEIFRQTFIPNKVAEIPIQKRK